jgi:MFS family permease
MPEDSSPASEQVRHDPYAVLRERNFRLYLTGNVLSLVGMQMQTMALAWEIYERTNSKMALGLAALTEWVPVISLALYAGHIADRVPRKKIIISAMSVISLASLGLSLISTMLGPTGGGYFSVFDPRMIGMYACLLINGIARAFMQPAKSSFLPQLVPKELFPNAVSWSMIGFQLATVTGSAVGGMSIYWFGGAKLIYLCSAVAAVVFVGLLLRVVPRPTVLSTHAADFSALMAGIKFVWRSKIILGAITLDMFAVLLGGATMLFPVYAKDILQVGPKGLGYMDAAPTVGALLMSFVLAHLPPMKHAGRTLLWAVAGFGAATIIFGLSRRFELSLVMLFLLGAFDMISVVIRHTLVQVLTPDSMRGRVSAVNGVFIGSSNQLGGFESALVAELFGTTFSVVAGGIGTMLVVAALAWVSPSLRRFGRLDGK